MKRHSALVISLAAAFAVILPVAAASTQNVADGGSFTLDPSDAFNAGGNTIQFAGSGTLVVSTPVPGTKLLVVGPNIVADAANAVLTIDLSAVPSGCETLFNGHLINDASGKTVVTGGSGRLLCGQAAKSGVTASHTSVYKLFDVTGVTGVTLTNQFTLVAAPAGLDLAIADGANGAFASRGLLDRFVMTVGDVKTLNLAYNAVLMSLDALSDPEVKIVVPAGLLLSLYQAQVTALYKWSSTSGGTFPNAIELAASSSQLSLTSMYAMEVTGAVSGPGEINRNGSNSAGDGTVHLNGGLGNFTGAFKNTGSAGKVKVTGNFAPASITLSGYSDNATNATIFAGGGVQRLPAGGISCTSSAGRWCIVAVEENAEVLAANAGFLSGNIILKGGTYATSRIVVQAMAPGDFLGADADVAIVPAAALFGDPAMTALNDAQGRARYFLAQSTAVCDLAGVDVGGGRLSLVAKDGVAYSGLPANVSLTVANGVSATLRPEGGAVTNAVAVAAGGSLALSEPLQPGANWRSKLLARFDPSVAESVGFTSTASTYSGMAGYQAGVISNCLDGVSGDYRLRYQSSTQSTWPSVIAGAEGKICPAGLSFITCNLNNTRYSMMAGESTGISTPLAVMVFGSHPAPSKSIYGGGGEAVFAANGGVVTAGSYARGGTATTWDTSVSKPALPTADAPIFATNGIPLWVDGVATDGTTTGFNGGWQVLSVGTAHAEPLGIGYRSSHNNGAKFTAGGQNYGEILLFAEMPTDAERQAAERYLAEKWGIAYQGPAAPKVKATVRVDGTGAVTLGADTVVAGGFAGTLDLAGHAAEFADEPPPPGAEVVPAAGRLAWFDPDDDSTLDFPSGSHSLNRMYQHGGSRQEGEKFLNSAGRPPLVVRGVHGAGPERNWLYYSPYNTYGATGKTGSGLSLRLNEVGQAEAQTVEKPITCKTLIMVQDSCAGGGTPFQDNRNAGGQFGYRIPNRVADAENPLALASTPIWADSYSAATMKSGRTYLDNAEVDGTATGFTGGPETLAVTREAGFNVGYFANLYYQNNMTDFVEYGEIQGEILMFDSVLADDVRSRIDAYLAWKWFGAVREGYTRAGGATIAGASGSVKVNSIADMPAFAPGFAGTAAFAENAFTFAIDGATGQVANPIALGNGGAVFPAAVTVTVNVAGRLRGGAYNLISAAGGGLADTAWTLVTSTRARLHVTDTAVELVRAPGFAVSIR